MTSIDNRGVNVSRMTSGELALYLKESYLPSNVIDVFENEHIDGSDFTQLGWQDVSNLLQNFRFKEKKAVMNLIEQATIPVTGTPPITDSINLLNLDTYQHVHTEPAQFQSTPIPDNSYSSITQPELCAATSSNTYPQDFSRASENQPCPQVNTPVQPGPVQMVGASPLTSVNVITTPTVTPVKSKGKRKRGPNFSPQPWRDVFEVFDAPKLPGHLDTLLKKKTARDLPWKILLQCCRSIQFFIESKLQRKPMKPERDAIARDFIRVYPCLASLNEDGPKEAMLTEQIRIRWKNKDHTLRKNIERLEKMECERRCEESSMSNNDANQTLESQSELFTNPAEQSGSQEAHQSQLSLPSGSKETQGGTQVQSKSQSIHSNQTPSYNYNGSMALGSQQSQCILVSSDDSQAAYHNNISNMPYEDQPPHQSQVLHPNKASPNHVSHQPQQLLDSQSPSDSQRRNRPPAHATQEVSARGTVEDVIIDMETEERNDRRVLMELQKPKPKTAVINELLKLSSEYRIGWIHQKAAARRATATLERYPFYKKEPEKIVQDMIYLIQKTPSATPISVDSLGTSWNRIEESALRYGATQQLDISGIKTLAAFRVLESAFGGKPALGKMVTVVDDAGKLTFRGKDAKQPRLGVLVYEGEIKQFVVFLEGTIFCTMETDNVILGLLTYLGVHFLCNFDYIKPVKGTCNFLEYFWLHSKDQAEMRGKVKQVGLAIMRGL